MIVSFNFYYAREGLADAVLQQRLRASEVRERMRLPYGRVLKRIGGTGELPDVIWDIEFAEVAGHHADMAARAASPEFESIRAGMRQLIRRFERPLFEVHAPQPAPAARAARLVTLDWIFCAPEKIPEVSAVLEAEAAHHAARGHVPGRLLRLITPGSDLPQLVWQREYGDAAGDEPMPAELASSAALPTWHAAVRGHAHDVRRSLWRTIASAGIRS